jgi:hypothetical protein
MIIENINLNVGDITMGTPATAFRCRKWRDDSNGAEPSEVDFEKIADV